MPEVGEKAPDFALYDTERRERRLSEFLAPGRKTILAFFPGAFTSVCTQELCTFRDMLSELQALNGQLVAISVDSPFANRAFAEKNNLAFPILSDYRREVIRMYDVVWNDLAGLKGYVSANRALFILDDTGKILYKWVAPNPGVLPNFDDVKAILKRT
jgi:peroxiredoxin